MALSATQVRDWLIGAGVVAVLAGGYAFIHHERDLGADKVRYAQADSITHAAQHDVAAASAVALHATQQADQQAQAAKAQVARAKALQAHSDSIARVSSHERDSAAVLLADTGATVLQLRGEIGRLAAQGRADSASMAQRAAADSAALASLILTVHADSAALAASRAERDALARLNVSTAAQVAALRKAQPSTFGNVVRYTVAGLAGVGVGRLIK